MKCPNCGVVNPSGSRFCNTCGTPLAASPPPPPRPKPSPTPSPQRPSAPGKGQSPLIQSLGRLGLPVTRRQLIGLGIAILTGMIVARALPYIYPLLFARILDFVLGQGISATRDSFNSFFMTTITFCSSFLVAVVMALLFKRGKRRA